MRTIDEYLDAARARQKIPSDRQLALALGMGVATINHMRTRRAWPSDATMIRIAELAGIPSEDALLDLSVWRNDDPKTRATWAGIAAKLAATAGVVALVAVVAWPHPAWAGTVHEQGNSLIAAAINYAAKVRRLLRRLRRLFAPPRQWVVSLS